MMLQHVVRGYLREPFGKRPRFAVTIIGVVLFLIEILLAPSLAAAANLVSVVIRGSSVYDAPALYSVYREQLGKPVTQESARAIVAALASRYQSDGYSSPQIKLDAALLAAGVLRIDVFEAKIAEVRISGDPGPHLARLESLGSRLSTDGPVKQAGVQAALRQMRSLPGLTVSATTANDTSGQNVYRLDVDTDFERMGGAVRLSNRGTDEAGPNFLLGQVMANGLLGGQTNLGVMFGAATDYDEYHGVGLLANVGVGSNGARFASSGFRSRSNPHEQIVDRDDQYFRDRVTTAFARPLGDFERVTLTVSAGLDLDDLEITRAGLTLRDERLRMVKLGSALTWRGGSTVQYVTSADLVKGLDALGSGLYAADLRVDPRSADFTLSRMSFTRLSQVSERWSVRIDALSQTSAYVLPYGERFKIGGERLGRGFEVAEIAGDQGIGAKIEGRSRLLRAPESLGRASLYTFYDIGAAWKQDAPGRESAATAGFGFATQRKRFSSTLELAQPLTHADAEGRNDLTLFAEFAMQL